MPTTTAKSRPQRKQHTFNEVFQTLKSMGTAQNIKIYKRHGAPDNMFGVSFANLGKLRKQIKRDHALALKLWATGNQDAMILAAMIVDPDQVTEELIDAWVRDFDYFMVAQYFVENVVLPMPHAKNKMREWIGSEKEYIKRCGYSTMAYLAKRDEDSLTDKRCETYLKRIEREIHTSPNRAREAMNSALIAIGKRNPHLHKLALATAKRIGPIKIDHGKDTHCKDVDATERLIAHRF